MAPSALCLAPGASFQRETVSFLCLLPSSDDLQAGVVVSLLDPPAEQNRQGYCINNESLMHLRMNFHRIT